ncbi:MAG: redoxin domain-containing protein [Elusimicrobia bacterium]|nr:redoxin domain-containing protein [Elusimicrobiota bacterium]
MKINTKSFPLAAFFLSLTLLYCPVHALAPGDKIPSFALNTIDGQRTTLEDLFKENKPVLISFFATWCKPCLEEMPDVKKIHQEGRVKVALVSLDTDMPAGEIKAWVSSQSVNDLLLLLDPKGIAGNRFGVVSGGGRANIPHVFLVSPQAALLWDHNGLDKDLVAHVNAEADKWQTQAAQGIPVKKEETPPNAFWLLFTNSANGSLVSCNCPRQPLGGLSRRAGFIEKEKEKLSPLLIVDTGDNMPTTQADEKKCLAVTEALGLIPYDAMVPGEQEFTLGAKFALDKILLPERPYLTLNLGVCPDKKTCAIPYQGHKIIEKGGLKIGLIGIFHEDVVELASSALKKSLKIFPLEKKLRAALKSIRPQADVVILLSHSGLMQDQALAEQFPEIDLIVGGHSQDLLKKPVEAGKVKILQAGPGGQYVGRALVVKKSDGVAIEAYDLFPLGIDVPDNPKIVQLDAELKK